MVAYSFKARFAAPILLGLEPGPIRPGGKRQTIRAKRKRHARSGEELQLYTGMRTRSCRLLGRPTCLTVSAIRLVFGYGGAPLVAFRDIEYRLARDLDAFAIRDGFGDWRDLVAFWEAEHEALPAFSGVLIEWEPKAGKVAA